MTPDHGESFRTIFKRLDARARREFVAALYAARGWDTRLENGCIVATRDTQTRRIAVLQPRRFGRLSLPDVDVVVVTEDNDAIQAEAENAGIGYETPSDIRNLLLYGLGREKAADLFEAHFDRPLTTVESTSETDGTATPLKTRLWSPDLTAQQVGIVVAVLLVGAVWLTGAGLLPSSESPNPPPESNLTYTPDRVGAIGGEQTYPQGLGPEGVENSGILAEAHAQYLNNRSHAYRIRASGPQHAPFMLGLSSWNATVRIQNWTHYKYRKQAIAPYGFRVKEGNETSWDPIRPSNPDNESEPESLTKQVYSDGTTKYWRFDGPERVEYRRASVVQQGGQVFGIVFYLQVFLWAKDSSIRCLSAMEIGDCQTYRVEVTGDPVELREDIADYRAVAVVESSGFVRSLTVRYTISQLGNPDERVEAQFHLEYVAIGNKSVSISPPKWLDSAKNRTDGTDTDTSHGTEAEKTYSTNAA